MPRDMADAPFEFASLASEESSLGALIRHAPDPDPTLATRHPDRLLAFLFVSPRPCAALDRLVRAEADY